MGDGGKPLPALAQVAAQQGEYLGRALAAAARGRPVTAPFRFHNRGNTAVIGRNAAVFDFGRFHLRGRAAWFLWALVHIYLLIGFENRLSVTLRWIWRYISGESGARLITPGEGASRTP
jgi:NADH dehydrogenase